MVNHNQALIKPGQLIEPPLFTFRGHKVGVTCLAQVTLNNIPHLVSGDESGELCLWNLISYRKVHQERVSSSRLQTIKTVNLVIKSTLSSVLVIQSRDNGIILIDPLLFSNRSLNILASIASIGPLFSRGDALNISSERALLLYPSALDSHLVSLRIVAEDAKTLDSGTAQRFKEGQKTCSVFDIRAVVLGDDCYLICVAYEDGHICIYNTDLVSKSRVPALNATGLKIEMIKDCDLRIGDFVSAFDIVGNPKKSMLTLVCGSPKNELVYLTCDLSNCDKKDEVKVISLKRPGTSVICTRPDNGVLVSSGWDSIIRIFSTDDLSLISQSKIHTKQTQSVLFIPISQTRSDCDASDHEDNMHGKYLMLCASLEGTISVSTFID